jgi:diguanylate cyclase (GGDEF)-like protein
MTPPQLRRSQKGTRVTRIDQPAGVPDAAAIVASIGEVAYEWRIDTDALSWSTNAAAVLGVDPAAIASGRAYAQHVEADAGQSRADAIAAEPPASGEAGMSYQLQYAFKRAGADTLWLEDSGRWFAGADGRPARAHGIVRAVNERHEREHKLLQAARFDSLTGEMNRAYLIEILTATLEESVRFRGTCGFLLIAIDRLGRLNEAYGFDVAEEVITKVVRRIRARLRGKDYLGRFAGNKFGVILTQCTPDELSVAAERLLAGVREENISTAAGPVAVTISIGGVTAPRHARTVQEVITRAQEALHNARGRRQGSFLAYQPNLEREALRRDSARATDEIISALNERRVLLAYEPVVAAQGRQLAFYECLMRIKRPDGRIIHANEIFPIAERLGLVGMLDHRVLELVVNELTAAPELKVSVNVSPASTVDPGWWLGLGALLRANSSAAQRLIIEITETAAIHDVDDARGFVTRVKDLGCRIAIDDFGAGHTSFRSLRKLGVDIIKIDGAFVQNLVKSQDDRAFVQTMIDLARRLKLESVAEWVQDEEAASLLAGWGCDYLQGVLIGLASSQRPWAAASGQAAKA